MKRTAPAISMPGALIALDPVENSFPQSLSAVCLQYASWTLPITHSPNGFRGAMQRASCCSCPYWLFARAVERAKIDGTLGQY